MDRAHLRIWQGEEGGCHEKWLRYFSENRLASGSPELKKEY
jgi:hypothetical protein